MTTWWQHGPLCSSFSWRSAVQRRLQVTSDPHRDFTSERCMREVTVFRPRGYSDWQWNRKWARGRSGLKRVREWKHGGIHGLGGVERFLGPGYLKIIAKMIKHNWSENETHWQLWGMDGIIGNKISDPESERLRYGGKQDHRRKVSSN